MATAQAAEGTVQAEAAAAARQAGLVYVSDEEPGYYRLKSGKGFRYVDSSGAALKDKLVLERIRKLGVPPAYRTVWICKKANGHIQATGRDDKGRKQYRYHADWQQVRDQTKYTRMLEFVQGLPALRKTVDTHMSLPGLPRDKVLATVVRLLETTLIRVGNEDYVRQNRSYGLTTLRDRHLKADGKDLRFVFKGKSGKEWEVELRDRRVAKIVQACQDLPGQQLFQYIDENGERRGVDSDEVNTYLRDITGQEISAKDFRTWAGTVLAAMALRAVEREDDELLSERVAKGNIKRAIEQVAQRLGNTPTICRKCYVHPEVFEGYLSGDLLADVSDEATRMLRSDLAGLRPEEATVLVLLQQRLKGAQQQAAKPTKNREAKAVKALRTLAA